MSKKLTRSQTEELAKKNGYEFAMLQSIINVESGGHGFDPKTGKIIIQFEKSWFKRKKADWLKDTKNTVWQSDQVGNQVSEWKYFNSAFYSDPNAAMESTSIGMMQVMGFHYKSLGFKTVGAMWDYAQESEANQVDLAIRFIKNNPKLDKAVKEKNYRIIAYYYNGEQYEMFNYHTRLEAERLKALR